jgi:hypothetical protein
VADGGGEQKGGLSVAVGILIVMGDAISSGLRALARDQAGLVTRRQALDAGMSVGAITARIRFSKWQRVHPGVYAMFTGPMNRSAQLWSAVLVAGRGAQLSHESAAEILRLTDRRSPFIHVTIPVNRRVIPPPGVRVHISSQLDGGWRFPRGIPPHTLAEETVIDLVHAAGDLNDVIAYVTGAFARNLTDAAWLRREMASRPRLRWRAELDEIIAAGAGGAHSVIEYRYDRDVEQTHGLPPARKQVPFTKPDGSRGFRDRCYEDYALIIELDGKQYHPDELKGRDQDRDNHAAAITGSTLRYGWIDVTRQPCATAAQVHAALTRRGYTGSLKPCSPTCGAFPRAVNGPGR